MGSLFGKSGGAGGGGNPLFNAFKNANASRASGGAPASTPPIRPNGPSPTPITTHNWARAAGSPMPGAGTAPPGANPAGTGAGPTIGSLRPKPNPVAAGINEKPAASGGGMNLNDWMYQMLGLKPPAAKAAAPAAAPAAGLRDNSTPARMDRASRLFEMGAGLMD